MFNDKPRNDEFIAGGYKWTDGFEITPHQFETWKNTRTSPILTKSTRKKTINISQKYYSDKF